MKNLISAAFFAGITIGSAMIMASTRNSVLWLSLASLILPCGLAFGYFIEKEINK